MSAETNLQKLLSSMKPDLAPEVFVYATIPDSEFQAHQIQSWGWFREREGITLIVEKKAAVTQNLDYTYASRLITLNVHSSLEAIGFLAVITDRLAAADISVNVISAYYHDHLFVPMGKAEQTMLILHQIMEETLERNFTQLPSGECHV